MKCMLGVCDGSMPKEGCESLWQNAQDLQYHFEEKIFERRNELIANRDCIVRISDRQLLAFELEECGYIHNERK